MESRSCIGEIDLYPDGSTKIGPDMRHEFEDLSDAFLDQIARSAANIYEADSKNSQHIDTLNLVLCVQDIKSTNANILFSQIQRLRDAFEKHLSPNDQLIIYVCPAKQEPTSSP